MSPMMLRWSITTLAAATLATTGACGDSTEEQPGIAKGWRAEPVAATVFGDSFGFADVRLACDENDTLHLVVPTGPGIAYGSKAAVGGSWSIETIPGSSPVGRWLDLSLGLGGAPHVVFFDEVENNARWGTRFGGAWSLETVDAGQDVGHYCAVAVGPGDVPHVAFHDNSTSTFTLEYAFRSPPGWTQSTIDDDPMQQVGEWSTIAVDEVARVFIAYQDARVQTAPVLRLARGAGGTWTTEVVDPEADTGSHTAIALGIDHNPRIAYRKDNSGDLRFARFDGAEWMIETLDAGANSGFGNALVLDDADRPHLAYCAAPGARIKYAFFDGSEWQITTVDTGTTDDGQLSCGSTAIALDARNRPHILYAYHGETILKHAWQQD